MDLFLKIIQVCGYIADRSAFDPLKGTIKSNNRHDRASCIGHSLVTFGEYFIASGDHTAVIIGQHNDRLAFQFWLTDTLTGRIEIVAVD